MNSTVRTILFWLLMILLAVVLWKKFGEFDGTRDFRKWAFGVARFEALAFLRD